MQCLFHATHDDQDSCLLGGKQTGCGFFRCFQTVGKACSFGHEMKLNGKECGKTLVCGECGQTNWTWTQRSNKMFLQDVIKSAMDAWTSTALQNVISLTVCRLESVIRWRFSLKRNWKLMIEALNTQLTTQRLFKLVILKLGINDNDEDKPRYCTLTNDWKNLKLNWTEKLLWMSA